MTTAPPGWFPDPGNGAQQRYWDGERWTEHVAPAAAPQWPSAQTLVQSRAALPPAASFGSRLAAFLIDMALLATPMLLLGGLAIVTLLMATSSSVSTVETSASDVALPAGFGIGLILLVLAWFAAMIGQWLYFVGFEAGRYGQTPGKWMMGIRVLDARTAEPPTTGRAFLRYAVKSFASGAVMMLGYLWMLWDEENRTWHDMAAETRVVDAGPERLPMREVWAGWTLSRRAGT